jgi:hypothetical protein
MNAKSALAQPHVGTKLVAAALSALIGISLLSAVTGLFQRNGTPFDQVVAAERACADRAYVSEIETCVRSNLAASRLQRIAGR